MSRLFRIQSNHLAVRFDYPPPPLHRRRRCGVITPEESPVNAKPADFGPRSKPTDEQLERRFAHHPPKDDQAQRYGQVRSTLLQAAKDCVALTPVSPEQTRAINALHEAMMLFNAAIACNE